MTIRLRKSRVRPAVCVAILIGLCLISVLARDFATVSVNPPILISQPTSTRAIAIDSLSFASEPFALTSPYAATADRRTRVMLFAVNLRLQPGETLSSVTADAEDAAHQHYSLAVEYVGPVPQQEWLSAVVLRVNDNLGDVGDVLVRVSYNALASNRVRIGIGHVGGGPPNDQGAIPTPVKPFVVSGQTRDDNNDPLAGVELKLTDITAGTIQTTTAAADGRFTFDVLPGHSVTVTPTSTGIFGFSAQPFDQVSGDQVLAFRATRFSYTISGKVTGSIGSGIVDGVTVNLSGATTATTITDSNGNYSFASLAAGRDYTITIPQTVYYTFANRSFSNFSANQIANFQGALRSYTVSGWMQLLHSRLPGLLVLVSGSQTTTVTTDDNGNYSIALPAGGNYVLTPSVTYYYFNPDRYVVTDLRSDLGGRYFSGNRLTFSITGKLLDQEGNSLAGMTVVLAGPSGLRTRVTDGTGRYLFDSVEAGYNYTITPNSNADYVFAPHSFIDLTENQTFDFTGLHRWTLSGRVKDVNGVGLIGMRVNLSGTESASTMTAADGSYSLRATATGNYTVTPSIGQSWYTFAPATAQYNNLSGDQTRDFTATLALIPDPPFVLEFDGTPKTVDYGPFWQEDVNLGHFFWEFWARPGSQAGGTYLLSDGYGGAHALLFGVGSFGSSEVARYEMTGNIFDGVTPVTSFGSDVGPTIGEWAHFAVGWDGQNIITYYNGVPVGKTPFAGPRRTPGPGGGGGRLLIGGSDHHNFDGRIAQVRGYEDTNPREGLPGGAEASFAPQTVFGLSGNLLSYYFRSSLSVADLSYGYNGLSHQGVARGTTAGIIYDCGGCPPPEFVIDPSAPNFATGTPPPPGNIPPAALPPDGALIFDSFSRANSTYTFGGHGGLSSTESGSAGIQVWQTNQAPANPQPFGILNSRAVLLANSMAVAWVPTGSVTGDVDVRVNRRTGRFGSGVHTGLSFRVANANKFFFAYTEDSGGTPSHKILRVGYYLNGGRVELNSGEAIPDSWITLRVVTRSSGDLNVYIDATLVYSTNNPVLATATGAGLYSNSSGMGLVNRWDNFTVFPAP
ncbi:MAG TPA: SdrD B-like domain-containing protein [Pyrinomonadaceae bacterium]|nr:SdrD B-like domain-containing protein [Pyrinomonadaceae bacterium]